MRRLLQVVFILSVSSTAFAQWANIPPPDIPRTPDGKPNLSAPAPRLPDGKPDLSGIWNPPTGYLRNLAKDLKEDVPFQPWAKALYDERAAGKFWREEPDANCLPQGVPKVLLAPAPWQIVQTPKVVFFIHEAFNLWWQAFMDGRRFVPHPDVAPTSMGWSLVCLRLLPSPREVAVERLELRHVRHRPGARLRIEVHGVLRRDGERRP